MKQAYRDRIERITLTIFLICMVITAVGFIIGIWSQTDNEALFMTLGSLFIIGLANFLIWLPTVLYRLIHTLSRK